MPKQSYFLKYPEYRRGVRFAFDPDDDFIFTVAENVEKEPEDHVCQSGEELLSELHLLYPHPRPGYGQEPWGTRLFLAVFSALFDSSRYYRVIKPARLKKKAKKRGKK